MTKDARFSRQDVDIQQQSTVYRGFFRMDKLQLRHRLFEGGWSKLLGRELFRRGDAAAAIIYDPAMDSVGVIEQFRVGALNNTHGPWLLEVVAGMIADGETPDQVIVRELAEEAGVTPQRLLPICNYLSSPGGTDERVHLYCALCDLAQVGGIHGLTDEGEDIRVLVLPVASIWDTLYHGRFNNAATLISLQWLMAHRPQLCSELRF